MKNFWRWLLAATLLLLAALQVRAEDYPPYDPKFILEMDKKEALRLVREVQFKARWDMTIVEGQIMREPGPTVYIDGRAWVLWQKALGGKV